MFRSAVIKLTAWYVGALVLVCLLFSLPLYNVAVARLRRGAERQTDVVRRLPNPFVPDNIISQLEDQREQQLDSDRKQLISSLILTNMIIVAAGAIASYEFARRTLKPIEEAHAAQAKFTANASHELRTPLAVMQTEIEVALRNKNLKSADARQILTSNLEEVARMRQLSDQLLGLTRTENELNIKDIKLDELLHSEIKKLSNRHKISIKEQITNNIIIPGDPLLLRQVLDILVENSVIYCGKKDPELRVTLSESNENAIIKVSDKGNGIKPSEVNHIFERFYRGSDAAKLKSNGHGLGLSLAKDIIARHSGEIIAKSKPGSGTEFTISLPIVVS